MHTRNRAILYALGLVVLLITACASTVSKQTRDENPSFTPASQDTLWKEPPGMPLLTLSGYQPGIEVTLPAGSLQETRDRLVRSLSAFGFIVDTSFASAGEFVCRTAFAKMDSLKDISPKLWVITSLLSSLSSKSEQGSGYKVNIRQRTLWAVPPVDTSWRTIIPLWLHDAISSLMAELRDSLYKPCSQDSSVIRRRQ